MMNSPQPSMPASTEQIAAALQILFNSMRFPPGVDAAKAIFGYINALQGFPIEAIAEGIRKYLRGECEDVSLKFCPHPPELAAIVRGVIPNRRSMPGGKYYSYKSPKSELLESRVTKEYGRQLVDSGVHPRGSIWLPGDINDRPDIGDLYGPDPKWKLPVPLGDKS